MEKKSLSEILFALVSVMSFMVITTGLGAGKKTWSFELKEITSTSSDTAKINIALEIERVSRGVFAISGEFLINIDIVEGDSNNIQVKSFRSAQGDSDYKVLPFQVPNSHFFKILNTYYKDVLMNTLKQCSDMPFFEDKFEPPMEKKTYKFEGCQFTQDGLPNHLQEGFYKVQIIGSGEVDYQLDIIAEVTNDI